MEMERLKARVPAIDVKGKRWVAVDLDPNDEWVYVRVQAGTLTMWTGPACGACKASMVGLRRCRDHFDLYMVALQLKLFD